MKIQITKNDRLFSHLVRLNAGGFCEYCGGTGTQTSHFHSRRKRSTRWDLDNAIWSCFSCHRFLDEHPNKHTEFFRKRLGSERFEQLNIRAETIAKVCPEKVEAELKDKIRILEEE